MVAVLDLDPGLGADLDSGELSDARRTALAPLLSLDAGRWSWSAEENETQGHLGLLVIDGLLTRRETVGELDRMELLGTGDLLRPWIDEPNSSLLTVTSWEVLAPARVAVLDRDFALRVRAWPEIVAALLDRTVLRSRSLGVTLAIQRAVRLQQRVELMLWHLADRWGHVTPEGTVLSIPLTHETISRLVGARRPPVTAAIGRLRQEGVVQRDAKGAWIIRARPAHPSRQGSNSATLEAPAED